MSTPDPNIRMTSSSNRRNKMAETKVRIISKAIGRRKQSIASVRLVSGKGDIIVNDRPVTQYFPGDIAKMKYNMPFKVVDLSKYDVSVKVHGGGLSGQLDAMILGIARSLAEMKEEYKIALRNANLLTRDPRERQRRMVGTGGKARRQKQSPKR